jgi:hypothetical protein
MKNLLFVLFLFVLPGCAAPRTGLGLDGTEEDPEEYKIAHSLDHLLMPDTSGIDLPPPKDSVLYGQFREAVSVSVEPAPVVKAELSQGWKRELGSIRFGAAGPVETEDRPDEIRGLDLYRAPVQPSLSKHILSINASNTIKALKRGRLQTREEALPGYIAVRVDSDEEVREFRLNSTLTGKAYEAALAELKMRIAVQEYGYQKSVNGLSDGGSLFSSEALENFHGMTCASANAPIFAG